MQLVEAGKVELDDPVQRYLPWFRLADPKASAQISVRHLLNQTSGLPMLPGVPSLADLDDRPDALEHQVRALSTLKLIHPPGRAFEYSNINYNILGLIVAIVSGQSYPEYIQTHIFNPLAMDCSYTAQSEARQNGLAVGCRHWFGVPLPAKNLPVPSGSLPSGQLISCTEDLANYLIAHLDGGRFGYGHVLSGRMDALHRGVAEFGMLNGTSGRYGMGWIELDLGTTRTYSHGGNVPDFSSFAGLIPEKTWLSSCSSTPTRMGYPRWWGSGLGVLAMLAGQEPAPIRLDFIQWVMRLLPTIPLLQIAGAAAALRQVNNWRQESLDQPGTGRELWRSILLPLISNLGLAAVPLSLVRFQWRAAPRVNPDLYWTAMLSGAFAGV